MNDPHKTLNIRVEYDDRTDEKITVTYKLIRNRPIYYTLRYDSSEMICHKGHITQTMKDIMNTEEMRFQFVTITDTGPIPILHTKPSGNYYRVWTRRNWNTTGDLLSRAETMKTIIRILGGLLQ